MYDITNRETFDHLDQWLAEVKRHAVDSCIIIVAALKSDLVDERQVSEIEGQVKFSTSFGNFCFW